MKLLTIFSPKSMDMETYNEAMKRLESVGAGHPSGRILHVCYGDSPQLKIMTIWESREDFQAMAPNLLPIFRDLNLESGPPEIYEVHDLVN